MLLEQEIASVMAFALKYAENPKPYYWNVPKNFCYPAMFFPQPEITTGGETFNTYAMRYSWYINIFSNTTEKAYALAWKVLDALKRKRNLVPLLNEDGSVSRDFLRLDDPSVQATDEGVAQLSLSWTSRRPYDSEEVQKMVYWEANEAIKNAAERYSQNSPLAEDAQEQP